MFNNRRIGTDNGYLLACYFMPTWLVSAIGIWKMPIYGVYQRANVGPASFIADALQLTSIGMTRFAWLLALAKMTTVIFFVLFMVLSSRKDWRDAGNGEEALSIALIVGTLVSFASMVCASRVHEMEALRLHATETMLLLGGSIVMLLQPELKPVTASHAPQTAGTQPLSSPSS